MARPASVILLLAIALHTGAEAVAQRSRSGKIATKKLEKHPFMPLASHGEFISREFIFCSHSKVECESEKPRPPGERSGVETEMRSESECSDRETRQLR